MIVAPSTKDVEDRARILEVAANARNIGVLVKKQPNLTWPQRSAVEELLIAAELVRQRFSQEGQS